MKRFITLLISVGLLAGLLGCGDSTGGGGNSNWQRSNYVFTVQDAEECGAKRYAGAKCRKLLELYCASVASEIISPTKDELLEDTILELQRCDAALNQLSTD